MLRDSINFHFLIKALKSDESRIAIIAYGLLSGQSDIFQLRKYRDEIQQALVNAPKISLDQKVRLIALATDSIKFSNDNDTSVLGKAVKKYMLDTTAENRRIAAFDTNESFYEKLWAINDLILRGNRRCFTALILHFNEPSFMLRGRNEVVGPCTTRTLRVPIIESLSRFFPDEPLLNDSLYSIRNNSEKMDNRELVLLYFDKITQLAKKRIWSRTKRSATSTSD